MSRKTCMVLTLVIGVGAVPAQEQPRPAPAPPTDAPGETLRTSFLPAADLRIFTNGNTNVVGDEESAVGASVGLVLPLTWAKRLSTWSLSYSTGAQVYGEDHQDADDLSHHFSAAYNRAASRRWSFGFNLSGSLSEQQGFNSEEAERPVTLVPRTDVTRMHGGAHASVTTGLRSHLSLGINAGLNRYGDLGAGEVTPSEDLDGDLVLDPGEDVDGDGQLDFGSVAVSFVDSLALGGNVGWGMTVSERTTVGVGYGYGQIAYEEPAELPPEAFPPRDTTVHTIYMNSTRRLSQYTSGSLQLGVLSAQQDGAEDRLEPNIGASMTRQVSEQSTLSFGLRQSAGAGSGNGIATLDRGLYGSWSWGQPRISVGVGLAYWDRETLIDPLGRQEESTSTFQITESLGWTPGQRFSYGVFHSFRDQQADDPTFRANGYHSGGVFVRWNIRGRSARVG